jgi:hypothetical protein
MDNPPFSSMIFPANTFIYLTFSIFPMGVVGLPMGFPVFDVTEGLAFPHRKPYLQEDVLLEGAFPGAARPEVWWGVKKQPWEYRGCNGDIHGDIHKLYIVIQYKQN